MKVEELSSEEAVKSEGESSNASNAVINIEVAYATPQSQMIVPIRVSATCTVEEAIKASAIMEEFPEIDLHENKVGIFAKLTRLDSTLQDKDRIEIYRKLIADPKAVRKQRAAEGKKMKKGGGNI